MNNYIMPIIVVSGVALVGFAVYQYIQSQQSKEIAPNGRSITSGPITGGLQYGRALDSNPGLFNILNPVMAGSTPASATRDTVDSSLEDRPMAFRSGMGSLSGASFDTLTERF
jgi:hypothetical protein